MTDKEQAINYWRDRDKDTAFWFEAQTGILRDSPPDVSNFHQYRLPGSIRRIVEDAAEKAHLGPGGLEYPRDFLIKLEAWEKLF